MATTLEEQVSVDQLGPEQYVSRVKPARMGNARNIAYGGCAMGCGISAAYDSVPSKYLLYSVTGTYLGPALTDRKLKFSVRKIRDTRTFATRLVEISQDQDDGQSRPCMIMLADFQVKEPASMLVYSPPPSMTYSPPEKCLDIHQGTAELVRRGVATEEMGKAYLATFGFNSIFFETRATPEGVATNNLHGMARKAKTPQDGLPLTSKTSADWVRCRHPLPRLKDRFAGLGFLLDGALAFIPLTHSQMFLTDTAACSSLDFALRFFTGDLDLDKWHLRELKTVAGSDGRTYTEARFWDRDGNLVANMTQQSIMRPLEATVKAAL
ncbi:acylthioesterase ii [Colletotrichum truncatum]|uniref:Acylthioesterase ii n=1 Tax=Colletotrichum truncatum TaxID=5467 RepID=A0ACC3YHZ9_COLTU|nr:acylthioesterase ii [Colletotrichum truncatum]KAF6786048.1 acylthioesterase ii [Colletotrichum truncatum]